MNPNETSTERNKWLAALMGLAMPGLGQIYNGELIKGISYFVILQVVYVLGFRWTVLLPDSALIVGALCTVIAVLAIYAFAIVDAYRKAERTEISYQPASYNRWYFYLASWLLGWILVSGAVFGYVRNNLIQAYRIPTASMEPAILPGDRILADKTAYRRMAPHKGDVVVLVYPDDRSKNYIKRIEALPGETVTGADGTKKEVPHGYVEALAGETVTGANGTQKEVPHGYVYVLGDNRENSYDSRQFGFIPLTDVVAKARQVYYSSGPAGIRWNRIGAIISGQ
jgi:signal peptidase I